MSYARKHGGTEERRKYKPQRTQRNTELPQRPQRWRVFPVECPHETLSLAPHARLRRGDRLRADGVVLRPQDEDAPRQARRSLAVSRKGEPRRERRQQVRLHAAVRRS